MLIDWFTVCAQALNFLILVWLMKRFLYKPILSAIDVREKRIAKEISDAGASKAEAQKEHDDFQHKSDEFDKKRAALLSDAKGEAKAEHDRLFNEARVGADSLSAARHETLINDAHKLNQSIAHRTQQEVFAITRRTLTDLASTSLEERMTDVLGRKLREMDGEAKEKFGKALTTTTDPALVRSAYELPEEQRAAIQTTLNETFLAEVHVRFDIEPELICGIELSANGQKICWSISNYLGGLESAVSQLLDKDSAVIKKADSTEPAAKVHHTYKAEPKNGDDVDHKTGRRSKAAGTAPK
jgi:F-type H+-transporting ATPase subunit b